MQEFKRALRVEHQRDYKKISLGKFAVEDVEIDHTSRDTRQHRQNTLDWEPSDWHRLGVSTHDTYSDLLNHSQNVSLSNSLAYQTKRAQSVLIQSKKFVANVMSRDGQGNIEVSIPSSYTHTHATKFRHA